MEDLLLVLGLIVVTAIASGVLIPLLSVRPSEEKLDPETGRLDELSIG